MSRIKFTSHGHYTNFSGWDINGLLQDCSNSIAIWSSTTFSNTRNVKHNYHIFTCFPSLCFVSFKSSWPHYHDVTMDSIASQITSLTIVYSAVYSAADQRKHQSSASLAFVRGIHRGPVNSPHKGPVTRKMFPFDDVIMLVLFFGLLPPGDIREIEGFAMHIYIYIYIYAAQGKLELFFTMHQRDTKPRCN